MNIHAAFGPRGDAHIAYPACEAPASSTDALVELLERMKAEAERNARTIDALDRRTIAGAQQLHEIIAFNERAEAELSEIEAKSSSSAGTARAHAEVLAAEQRERALLDAESQHLEATLAQSESSLEEMQARSAADHAELARELPALRCAFRKRTREGHSNALRLACSLATLESEMGLLGSPDDFSKRAAWASPAF